jgi:hypothetical protein
VGFEREPGVCYLKLIMRGGSVDRYQKDECLNSGGMVRQGRSSAYCFSMDEQLNKMIPVGIKEEGVR